MDLVELGDIIDIDALPVGVIWLNGDGIIEGFNLQAIRLLGVEGSAIEGMGLEQVLPHLVFSRGECRITREIRDASGVRSLEIRKKPRAPEAGSILVIEDTTEREELRQELRQITITKNSYENILNSISEGIEVADRAGNIVFMNRSQEEIDEIRRSEAVDRHISEVYRLNPESSLMMRAMRTGKPIINEHQNYVTKHGKMVDIICTAVPIHEGKDIVGAVAITKDYNMARKFSQKILEMESKLQGAPAPVTDEPSEATYTFEDIIGQNAAFLQVLRESKKAASTDSPVLIFGETGSGKELFAQSIHKASSRSSGPFMAINCAAIPEGLLEGILFGTCKGAFTGAVDRKGLFEEASNGTIFLDEINSMQPFLQSKLLRVLQEGIIRRVGDTKERRANPRIISSMNVEPLTAVEEGRIRQDLFYRLGVVYLGIPPLRKRLEDIPVLVKRFIDRYNRRLGRRVTRVDQRVMKMFMEHDWRGNVRELEHCIESCMNMLGPQDEVIITDHLPYYFLTPGGDRDPWLTERHEPLRLALERTEMDMVEKALEASDGNVSRAARMLGVSRQNLQYRIKRLGLKKEAYQDS